MLPELAPFKKRQRRILEGSALAALEREHPILARVPVVLSIVGAFFGSVLVVGVVSHLMHGGFPPDSTELTRKMLSSFAGLFLGAFLGGLIGKLLLVPKLRCYVRRLVECGSDH